MIRLDRLGFVILVTHKSGLKAKIRIITFLCRNRLYALYILLL